MRDKVHYSITRKLRQAEGELVYSLDVFGDHIAEREGYKSVEGIEAIHFYLIHKFNWQPSAVKGMSFEDLRFILSEEMHGWTLPKEAL
ncbi:conserved hypothetical protein [Vibrio owensii]|uniref:Uncharacterized protein n=1 Tax=Vibrio owensii TaxID=696485 RepID=A0AAU9Q1B9_9VIBR|nr:hypothetical protein [Vibrio campbellii]CAH1522355.1 conserved hypothetical protein [Vibrio owensii]